MHLTKKNCESDSSKPTTETVLPGTQNAKHETRIAQRATRNTKRERCYYANLGLIDYLEAWNLQTDLVDARIKNDVSSAVVLFLEHPAVYTLGRRGGDENLLVSESFLEKSGIPVVQVERGGNITYHGPGQLIVYPIMNLHAARIGVVEFVGALEKVMLKTVALWGIKAEQSSVNRGIWIGGKKLGSIGIALRKGVSFHGLALNVNLDLLPFSWIQPCGLQDVQMTSMKQELSRSVSMVRVQEKLKENFESVFGMQFIESSYAGLRGILGNQKDEHITECV
ncbi:MAG: lipoyl(octanoyl) transferase LipB [Desulfobacterales bacterium]|jgi:lipoate-protein ligase B